MQEKAPYVSKAEKLKAEYTKKIDAYNNKQVQCVPLYGVLTLSGSAWTFACVRCDSCVICRCSLEAPQRLVILTSPSPR